MHPPVPATRSTQTIPRPKHQSIWRRRARARHHAVNLGPRHPILLNPLHVNNLGQKSRASRPGSRDLSLYNSLRSSDRALVIGNSATQPLARYSLLAGLSLLYFSFLRIVLSCDYYQHFQQLLSVTTVSYFWEKTRSFRLPFLIFIIRTPACCTINVKAIPIRIHIFQDDKSLSSNFTSLQPASSRL